MRPWPVSKPTKPGSAREWHAKAFGAANRACKITASKIYGAHWEATRGTPLLPRDLMIAFMYGRAFALQLDDGRIIRSMAAMNDVSKSLDLIGNTPGLTLRRGAKYWEAQLPAGPQYQGATLHLNADQNGLDLTSRIYPSWTAVEHDIGGWVDLAAFPQGFTVPADVSMVRIDAQVRLTSFGTGSYVQMLIEKNGSFNFPGNPGSLVVPGLSSPVVQLSSRSFPVSPGDEIRLGLSGADSGCNMTKFQSYFAIQQVG